MIGNFYKLHRSKGILYTYTNFKKSGFSKSQIYAIMQTFDQTGSVERKIGSGRPQKLDGKKQLALKNMVNHKAGVSQRKLANKFNIHQSTVGRILKKNGLKHRKRQPAPKRSEAQIQRQNEQLAGACGDGWANLDDPRDLVLDDESYFPLNGAEIPGNSGFYSSDPSKTPAEIKFKRCDKFPEKVMVWAVISKEGIGKIHVFNKHESMNGQMYREKCLPLMLKFVDEQYESRDQVIFWPDLATCHYTQENLDFLEAAGIYTVPKTLNPPNAPQIRPIEMFWGALKQKVYAKNWTAKIGIN